MLGFGRRLLALGMEGISRVEGRVWYAYRWSRVYRFLSVSVLDRVSHMFVTSGPISASCPRRAHIETIDSWFIVPRGVPTDPSSQNLSGSLVESRSFAESGRRSPLPTRDSHSFCALSRSAIPTS